MSLNKVIIMGNLGRDPELRYTAKQTAVCTLSIATTEKQKDASGAWVDHTEWHRVVVFGKQGENCSNYLKKGSQALVEGKLRTNKWQDKSGQDRYTTEIIAENVRFIGGGRGASAPSDSYQQFEQNTGGGFPANNAALAGLATADDLTSYEQDSGGIQDDDIPF